MSTQPKQIVIKKAPTLMVKKKERAPGAGLQQGGPSSASPYAATQLTAYHPGSAPSTGAPSAGLHCPQCGGRRIVPGSPQFFDFHCSYCGQLNQSRGYVSGTDMQCVACGNPILVPPAPLRPVPAHLGGAATAPQRFKFYCVFCGQKLSATFEMVGQPTVCPSCSRGLAIPQPPQYATG